MSVLPADNIKTDLSNVDQVIDQLKKFDAPAFSGTSANGAIMWEIVGSYKRHRFGARAHNRQPRTSRNTLHLWDRRSLARRRHVHGNTERGSDRCVHSAEVSPRRPHILGGAWCVIPHYALRLRCVSGTVSALLIIARNHFLDAHHIWAAAHAHSAFDAFRAAAEWRGASLLFPDVWNPSLNFTDPEYGNSEGFFNAYKAGSTETPLCVMRVVSCVSCVCASVLCVVGACVVCVHA